jgi:hypothetical protein
MAIATYRRPTCDILRRLTTFGDRFVQRKPADSRQGGGKVAAATVAELLEDPERLMNDYELAFVSNRSRSRIQKDRLAGRGPPFICFGKRRLYRVADYLEYRKSRTVVPQTAAAQTAGVPPQPSHKS